MYIPDLRQVLAEYGDVSHRKRNVSVIIPDKDELPENAVGTVEYSVKANLLAHQRYKIQRRVVDGVYLSDQSGKVIAGKTRGRLEERVGKLKEEFAREDCADLFPKIGYFRMDNGLRDLVLDNWSDNENLSLLIQQLEEKGMAGKGLNMYLSALLVDSKSRHRDFALLYLDADYRNRSKEQVLALALPLSHMKYDSVTGSFNRYHKNKEGKMERGGRVNVSTRAIFDMLSETTLMKDLGYPLCGDQGASIDVLRDLRWPMQFGIETAWRIQAHSYANGFSEDSRPLLHDRKSLQVDIGGNDDVPIGDGKSSKEVLKGIAKMSAEVAEAALATIDSKVLFERWPNFSDYMKEFQHLQNRSIRIWRDRSRKDYEKVLPICGDIDEEELTRTTKREVRKVVKRFYDDEKEQERLRAQFLPSLNSLETSLGVEYKRLARDLSRGLSYL